MSVGFTKDELEIINEALEDHLNELEKSDGPQKEVDEVETLQEKINQALVLGDWEIGEGRGNSFVGIDDRDDSPVEFTESEAGYRARDRWAERYDDLNGAPESDDDR